MNITQVQAVTNLRRLAGYLIDWYLCTALSGIPVMLIKHVTIGEFTGSLLSLANMGNLGYLAGILAIFISAAYYMVFPMLIWRGQTPGKRMNKTKIVQKDLSDVTLRSLFIRQILGVIFLEGGFVFSSQMFREMLQISCPFNIITPMQMIAVGISIVSIFLAYIRPEKRMIHDYISKTKVVYYN